jgi:hypothetical protein
LYGQFLKDVVGKAGPDVSLNDRTYLFNHGLQWFAVLHATRKSRAATREKRLAASEARFREASSLSLEAIRYVQDAVKEHFGEMERRGDLDWLPALSLDEYESSLLKPASRRELREEQRREFARRIEEYEVARRVAVEKVWQEVQPLLDEAGVPKERRTTYRGLVGACCTAALNFEPDSVGEKTQLDEYILNPEWTGRGLDTALAQKLADAMLLRFRELAKSLPPDPRSKR